MLSTILLEDHLTNFLSLYVTWLTEEITYFCRENESQDRGKAGSFRNYESGEAQFLFAEGAATSNDPIIQYEYLLE